MKAVFQKTNSETYHVIHLIDDNGKQDIEVKTEQQLRALKKSKRYKKIIALTLLQSLSISYKMNIYPEGKHMVNKISNLTHFKKEE